MSLTLLSQSSPVVQVSSGSSTNGIILVIDVTPAVGQKWLSYDDTKRIISGKFISVAEYSRYVLKHNLEAKGLPSNPFNAYKDLYKGVVDFLGGSASPHSISSSMAARRPRNKQYRRRSFQEHIANIKQEFENNEANLNSLCKFLASKKMLDILGEIAIHKNLTLTDARIITKFLISHYKD